MITFVPSVPIWFFMSENTYADGEFSGGWSQVLDFPLGCQWTGSFGSRLDNDQSQGVADSATVRTFYHPAVAMAMAKGRVLVCRHDLDSCFVDGAIVETSQNLYEVWGAADNVNQANQVVEFKVKRVEQL